ALKPHAPAHDLGEAFADRQTETGAAVFPRGGGVHLTERTEDAIMSLGRDADARVAHGKEEPATAGFVGVDADGDLHFPALGELEGVADQVDENLTHPGEVAANLLGDAVGDFIEQLETLLRGALGEQIQRALDTVAKAE